MKIKDEWVCHGAVALGSMARWPERYEELPKEARDWYTTGARAAIAAVAPLIAKEVIDACSKAAGEVVPTGAIAKTNEAYVIGYAHAGNDAASAVRAVRIALGIDE